MIRGVDVGKLTDDGRHVSVALVDSGFTRLPPYAVMHGGNRVSDTRHGDRVLAVFTALDGKHPLANLGLNLACYDRVSGYAGLARALSVLPDCDILSISIAWRDDDPTVRGLLESKFKTVCVPYPNPSLPYPAAYGFTTTCSLSNEPLSDWSICPNPDWRGNSYAVPAVARLLCYGVPLGELSSDSGIPASELFADCRAGVFSASSGKAAGKMACPHCHRFLRDGRTHGFMVVDSGSCPYCGLPLFGE